MGDFYIGDFRALDFLVTPVGDQSGPPYPYSPVPGSNAIGSFRVGVSPIGTVPPFDWWQTVISQYANSRILTQLLSNFSQYIDPTQITDSFFDFMFNVDTAQEYGLDVWGRIVGVTRIINVAAGKNFGYAEALLVPPGSVDANVDPYNQSPFYAGAGLTNSTQLSDDSFRVLIYAKALSNISSGSVQSINQLLRNLFPGRGNCYVVDGLNMTMVYYFNFVLSPGEQAILAQSGVLPKPVGVSASVSFI